MSKTTQDKASEMLEGVFVEPARAYGALGLEYCERLVATQLDAAQACTDLSLAQLRRWLEVKDPEGFQQACEAQRQATLALGERIKGDAEALSSLSLEYLEKGQKLMEASIRAVSAANK